jgi:hypothetical protein
MALTALAIRNAQPRSKPYKLSDERSLFLLVMPNGAKYWRFRYRFLDKQKTLVIGVWPEVTRTLCYRTTCSVCFGSGGKSGASKASCIATAGCSPVSTISSR